MNIEVTHQINVNPDALLKNLLEQIFNVENLCFEKGKVGFWRSCYHDDVEFVASSKVGAKQALALYKALYGKKSRAVEE